MFGFADVRPVSRLALNGHAAQKKRGLKPIAHYLKKVAGYHYPLAQILKGEPDREAYLVEELETELADIRKQLALPGKIRDAVQNFRKASLPGVN